LEKNLPIPTLRANGTLPPGEYYATLTEIIAAFPPRSVERQELNQALLDAMPAILLLKTVAPDVIIYIDGGFVTNKASPNDVDVLLLTDMLDEIQIQDFFNQECPVAATYLDLHADPLQRRHLVHVFTRTRNAIPKGIIILDI
jgi:hypothetical protein